MGVVCLASSSGLCGVYLVRGDDDDDDLRARKLVPGKFAGKCICE